MFRAGRHRSLFARFNEPTAAALALLSVLAATACSGGSGGGSGGRVDPPVVSERAPAYRSVVAGESAQLAAAELGITAAASDSLSWRQTGGPPVELAGADTARVIFDAPQVALSDTLELELLVTAAGGDEERVPLVITVVNRAQLVAVADASYRLDSREPNSSCQAPPPPPLVSPVRLARAFPALSLPTPVDMDQAPGDDSYWFVSSIFERQIYRFRNDPDVDEFDVVLDLSGRGRLRSMTFHPEFASNGKIYVQVHNGGELSEGTRILEFTWSAALDAFDPASERLILHVPVPHSRVEDGEHPGGQLNFGNDGYLYTVLGDGTQPGVFSQFSQDTDVLWGSMLRIDVDSAEPYAIPEDNPFANGGGRPEIFAWGFRHPWRWNFDRATGDIWLADVGWVSREEVNRVVAGGNYGWPLREGGIACPRCEVDKITVAVDPDSLLDPLDDYGRDVGKSVTGGYVYRGREIPDLEGVYLFGDYITGKVFALRQDGGGAYRRELLTEAPIALVSFGENSSGEIYALDFKGGGVYQLLPNPVSPDSDFPQLLSATGCVDTSDPQKVIPGMIPYTVQVPLWSDGAEKQRWLALPDGQTIDPLEGSPGDLDFPPGTVLVKHFRLFHRMIETRLFMRHNDGQWAGYSYEWNDSETDARLLPGAKVREVDGQAWRYPSRNECLQCHTAAAGRALGPTLAQLNTQQTDGREVYSQLRQLEDLGLFSSPPDHSLELAATDNVEASVEQRARAYLDANCAGCHLPGGGGDRSTMDLRVSTELADMNVCDALPLVDTLGNPRARLLAPGDPDNSLIVARMNRRDAYRMPPVGSAVVHDEAVALIADWIGSLASCE